MKRYLKGTEGISLIEILVSIAILGIIMAMNTQLLQHMITGSTRQNTIANTQYETTLGLELMRSDIEGAGYGLADDISGISYTEATVAPSSLYNDASTNVPRALVHSNNGSTGTVAGDHYLTDSDYLVIKATPVGENAAAKKWTYIMGSSVHVWGGGTPNPELDMETNDQMIVIRPRSNPGDLATLIVSGSSYGIKYAATMVSPYVTSAVGERFMAYGISGDHSSGFALGMPFNRADYYVRRDANSANCAPGTGTLIKATINHFDGGLTEHPLIACVANMQITFRRDADNDGLVDADPTNNISTLSAMEIKQQIKEVRIYLLAHEGSRDNGYNLPDASMTMYIGDAGFGRAVNLNTVVGDDSWRNYRWKTYKMIVKPRSLY